MDHAFINLDEALLRSWPLPLPSATADKDERGRVLIIGGSCEMPGAVILAATAALRAGAGKLTVATAASTAAGVALALPEARVIALPEQGQGGFAPDGAKRFADLKSRFDAVLLGPGMQDEGVSTAFVKALLPYLDGVPLILDALAMNVLRDQNGLEATQGQPLALTPHAGEFAHLTGLHKEDVLECASHLSREWSRVWQAVVVLKGARTHIASSQHDGWKHEGGSAGLATSGSGDTLAGIIAGLAARGTTLQQACAWGVVLHARAVAGHEHIRSRFMSRARQGLSSLTGPCLRLR